MQPKQIRHIILSILVCLSGLAFSQDTSLARLKVNVTDTFFGVPVADPYRWLESMNSDTTKNWLKEQRKITRREKQNFGGKYMGVYNKLISGGGYSFPNFVKEGAYYFGTRFQSTYTSPVLFYKTSLDGEEIVAFDPNNSGSKDVFNIVTYSLSEDAQYLAVKLSKSGSDWREIKIQNLATGKELPDKIEWVKFSNIVWFQNGFFYSRYKKTETTQLLTATNTQQQLFYHKLGQTQEQDQLIYSVPDKANTIFQIEKTSDNKHLIIYSAARLNSKWCNIIAYKNLEEGILSELKMFIATPITANIDYQVIDFINGQFAVKTNFEAPHYRVLLYNKDSINYAQPIINQYSEVIKQVYHIGGKLFCLYFRDGMYSAGIFDYEGQMAKRIKFSEGAGLRDFYAEAGDTSVLYFQSSFYTPPVAYRLSLNTGNVTLVKKTSVYYDAQSFTTKIVKYKSKDGTEVPMYLTYKKGLNLNGQNPVILYGYGNFAYSVSPFYAYTNIVLYENNGILAVPLIRGGGELGKEWHEQGRLLNKQNTFDDFIAAAEFLIDSGYTSAERLAIKSNSYGSLVVAATMVQRPDLFKVAIAEMGVYDMLRQQLFTIGKFTEEEYGTTKDSLQFLNLLKYSPLHNVRNGKSYPATLLIAAENDDRLPSLHSYKFLATLQEKSSGINPHILYFEDDAGHQGTGRLDDWYSRQAFELAFIFSQMNLKIGTGF